MSHDYFIKNFKKTHVHRFSIDSFIPLSKQAIVDVRSVLPSCELSPAECRRFLRSLDDTLLQTAPNVNQSLFEFADIVDLHLVQTLYSETVAFL